MYEEYLKHFSFNVSEDMKKFVEDIFKNKEYLFVRNDIERDYMTSFPRKVQYGYCSHCKNEYQIEGNIIHGEVGICDSCGAELQAKEVRYGKKKLRNEACFYWFGKSILDPNVVTCKGYYVSKDYDKDYKNPDYDFSLQAIYIFDANNQKSKMLTKSYWGTDNWDERASIFDFNNGWLANKWFHCSFDSLDLSVKDTVFKYSNYREYCGKRSIVKYLGRFNEFPWVEQLTKIGFSKIADDFIWKENMHNCLNYKGKDIFKKLRLNKREVKDIRESNVELTPKILRFYQLDKKHDSKSDIKKVRVFNNAYGWDYAVASVVLRLTSINKAMRYMSKQFKEFNDNCYSHKDSVINTWRDYIEACKKLCRDINNKDILFPKDLHKAHQNTIKLVKVEGDKRLDRKIEKRLEKLKDMYSFKDKDFLIRPAESSQDLIKEGDTLKHCVAKNYSIPYANGKTDILFLRRINSPNDPLVTIEVKEGQIVQSYGKNNKNPKEDEQKFIDKFKNKILSKLKSKKGKVA